MCVFVVVVLFIKIHIDQTRICTLKHFRLSFLFVLVTVLSSEGRLGQGMAKQSREGQVRAKHEALERGRTGQYMTGNAYVYFWARHLGSNCSNSWSLHNCYFYRQNELTFSIVFFCCFLCFVFLFCFYVYLLLFICCWCCWCWRGGSNEYPQSILNKKKKVNTF